MNRFRFLGTGWFWFAGTLVPVSGIVQGGLWPAMADRWAYVPYIGLFVILSWGGYEILNRYRLKKIFAAMTIVVVLALSAAASVQVKNWKNSKSVYGHALEVGAVNHEMLNNMGNVLVKEGKLLEAIVHYKKALALKPDYGRAFMNLAIASYKLGRFDESVQYFSEVVRRWPNYYKAHNSFGVVLMELGKEKEAVFNLREAIRLYPDYNH